MWGRFYSTSHPGEAGGMNIPEFMEISSQRRPWRSKRWQICSRADKFYFVYGSHCPIKLSSKEAFGALGKGSCSHHWQVTEILGSEHSNSQKSNRTPSERVLETELMAPGCLHKGAGQAHSLSSACWWVWSQHLNVDRETPDTAMRFSKDGATALHGKDKMAQFLGPMVPYLSPFHTHLFGVERGRRSGM